MLRPSFLSALGLVVGAAAPSEGQGIHLSSSASRNAIPRAEAVPVEAPSAQIGDASHSPYSFHKRLALWSLAATYATTVMTAAAMDDNDIGTTAIPIAGPWISMARIEGSSTTTYRNGGKPLLAASGLAQGGLLLYALVAWHHEQSYSARVTVLPVPERRGFALGVRF